MTPGDDPNRKNAEPEEHPDKTFIGRIAKGFDFLGYHFTPNGLTVAKAMLERFLEQASRLYEQKRVGAVAPDALGMYLRRWVRWARAGLGGILSMLEAGGPEGPPFLLSHRADYPTRSI